MEPPVQQPIIPIDSDTTPIPATPGIDEIALPEPQVASLDLTMPILEVLTDPTI